jgi:hypothetical protein
MLWQEKKTETKFQLILCAIDLTIHIIYDLAVKLLSILMNLGKIVLQVGCFDKIIQPVSSTFIHHSCINLQTKTFMLKSKMTM